MNVSVSFTVSVFENPIQQEPVGNVYPHNCINLNDIETLIQWEECPGHAFCYTAYNNRFKKIYSFLIMSRRMRVKIEEIMFLSVLKEKENKFAQEGNLHE